MIPFTIKNLIFYCILAWGTNISLNMLYVIKKKFPSLAKFDYPLDRGIVLDNKRLIGDSTTIPGLVLVILISIIFYINHFYFVWYIIPILVYIGHMMGSIIKRRIGKKDGEPVPFLDRADYMILMGLILWPLGVINYKIALVGFILTYILHPLVCITSYKLGMKKNPY